MTLLDLITDKRGRPIDLNDVLMAKVRRAEGGCLRWLGTHNHKGYGYVSLAGRSYRAHRVAYELWVGPIPDGLDVDHLCGVRDCIEPSHLEAVTHHVNLLRSNGPVGIAARKTHCSRGHELPEFKPGGVRDCRECRKVPKTCPVCGKTLLGSNLPRHVKTQHKEIA